MAKQYAQLEYIANNDHITFETQKEFVNLLQHSILLALKEQGKLNETQYQFASAQLQQFRPKVPSNKKRGDFG